MSTILTKALAVALVSILMVVMVTPQPVYAQGGLLSSITGILNVLNGAAAALQNFINNVMRPILQSISAAASGIQNILGTLRISLNRLFGQFPKSTGFGRSYNN